MKTLTTSSLSSTPRTRQRTSEFLRGVRDELPILVGTVPFGLIYGVSAVGAQIPAAMAQAMSVVIFAGSAQFVTAQLVGASLPALVIIVTGVIVNLRHLLYSASIAPYTRHLNRFWKVVLAYLLTDEAYAVAITHYRAGDAIADDGPAEPASVHPHRHRHWYFLGAGLALWSSWQASTAVGVFLGANVPPSWSLDFTLPLTFIALVVPTLKDRPSVAAALAAGLVAILAVPLPLKSGIIVATLAGLVVGVSLETRMLHRARGDSQETTRETPEAGESSSRQEGA
ncbi:MAG: AzlC family ABC transporter permease [Ktedonobacterales bacterium]